MLCLNHQIITPRFLAGLLLAGVATTAAGCSQTNQTPGQNGTENTGQATGQHISADINSGTRSTADTDYRTSDEAELRQLRDQLLNYSRQTRADNIDQCSVFEMGRKPCGGPERYMVYSQKDMNADDRHQLADTVQRYNQLDAFNKSTRDLVGNCQVIPEPKIKYENGHCVIEQSYPTF